jgi:hypothetical protein
MRNLVERLKREKVSSVAMVILTSLIALFSFIVAGVSVCQMSKYWQAVHIENRGYLVVEQVLISDYSAVSEPLRVEIFVKNVGKTPTRQVRASNIILVPTNGTQWAIKSFYVPDSAKTFMFGAGIEKPTILTSTDFNVTQQMPDSIYSGALTVAGRLFYVDVFEAVHYTSFCGRITTAESFVNQRPLTLTGNCNDAD